MRPVVTPRPQPPRPGLVLSLELEVSPAIREVISQLRGQHRLGAEHRALVTELQPSLSLIACIEAQINWGTLFRHDWNCENKWKTFVNC